MEVKVISTGSKGNAVLLNGEVLIDCGVSWKKLEPYVKGIKLVLLSHAHSDHFNKRTIKRLSFERPGIKFGVPEHLLGEMFTMGIPPRQQIPIDTGTPTVLPEQEVSVVARPLVHDVPNVAWEVWLGGESALYATDTQYIPFNAPGLDLYLIEANYTEAELQSRLQAKLDNGEYSYETSAFARHMSRERAVEWLQDNAGPDSKILFLHGHGGD